MIRFLKKRAHLSALQIDLVFNSEVFAVLKSDQQNFQTKHNMYLKNDFLALRFQIESTRSALNMGRPLVFKLVTANKLPAAG